MKNGDKPSRPGGYLHDDKGAVIGTGLNKREEFAVRLTAALLSSQTRDMSFQTDKYGHARDHAAREGVMMADALLAALELPPEELFRPRPTQRPEPLRPSGSALDGNP